MKAQSRCADGMQLGRLLATQNLPSPIIVTLPTGGAVVGVEVARSLNTSLGLVFTQTIHHPTEVLPSALAVVTEGGFYVCNEKYANLVSRQWLAEQIEHGIADTRHYRQNHYSFYSPPPLQGRSVVVVDDGTSPGITLLAALAEVRSQFPAQVTVAIPALAPDTQALLRDQVDGVLTLQPPRLLREEEELPYVGLPFLSEKEIRPILLSFLLAPPAPRVTG